MSGTTEQRRVGTHRLRLEVLVAYGGKCACCGESRVRLLQLDHVVSIGTNARPQDPYFAYRDARARNFPSDYQVLCVACNWLKRDGAACLCATEQTTAAEALAALPVWPKRTGYAHHASKPPAVVAEVRSLLSQGMTGRAIAARLPISNSSVARIRRGETHG